MGRTQAYNTEKVVRDARQVFWTHGFEGASVPDLEAATGLNRSSIYHAFGSKRGLFDAAVQSYLNDIVRPRLAGLHAPTVAPDALDSYLNGLRDALTDTHSHLSADGCLLVNAAGSAISRDDDVRRVISDYRTEMGDAIARGLAARRGTNPAPDDTTANAITGLVISALALTRADPHAALQNIDTARLLAES